MTETAREIADVSPPHPKPRSRTMVALADIRFSAIEKAPPEDWLTEKDVLDAHAQFGRLDWPLVKEAMGPNWPAAWERLGPGEGIFEPDEEPRP